MSGRYASLSTDMIAARIMAIGTPENAVAERNLRELRAEYDRRAADTMVSHAISMNPDNVTERKELGALIADLAEDDYVTTTEAAEVIAWCRDFAKDCDWADIASDDIDAMSDASLLRNSHRKIDGGLAFVLADVRRVMSTDGLDARYAEKSRDRSQERADDEYGRCPACGDPIDYCQGHGEIGDPLGFAILEAHDTGEHSSCHPSGCDDRKTAEWEAIHGAPDEQAREQAETDASDPHYMTVSEIAARIAKDAADSWHWDAASEDASDAATRALDIFRDLTPDDRVDFVTWKLAPYLVAELLGRL